MFIENLTSEYTNGSFKQLFDGNHREICSLNSQYELFLSLHGK